MTPLETIYRLAKDGCDIRVVKENEFQIMGFYKHGSITVNIEENWYSTRYANHVPLSDRNNLLLSLLEINYENWLYYKDRYTGWTNMESPWREYYTEVMTD